MHGELCGGRHTFFVVHQAKQPKCQVGHGGQNAAVYRIAANAAAVVGLQFVDDGLGHFRIR